MVSESVGMMQAADRREMAAADAAEVLFGGDPTAASADALAVVARAISAAMPARRDLDPLDMGPWLAQTMLVDVTQQPLDFRFRLVELLLFQHSLR